MEDRLKNKFEANNLPDFDNQEPLTGHEARFETKLLFANHKQNKEKKPRSLWPYLLLAACFLGVIFTLVSINMKKENEFAQKISLADVSPSMANMESYFTKEIGLSKSEIDMNDPELSTYIDKFIALELEYSNLLDALNKNTRNEKVISAMINNYKLRLKILESIKRHIDIKNTIKSKSNEKDNNQA